MSNEPPLDAVAEQFRAQLTAMTTGDTRALAHLLNDEFTLTHITGYVQPKDEWLREIRAGQFDYHHIEEGTLSATSSNDGSVVLDARIVADATVNGTRANWRLVLTQTYAYNHDCWKAMHSVATTW